AMVQQVKDDPAYGRYKSYKTKEPPKIGDYYELDAQGKKVPAEKGYLEFTGLFPMIAGLDGARVGVLEGKPGEDNGFGKTLETDIVNFTGKGASLSENVPLFELNQWWSEEGRPNMRHDHEVITPARLHGGKQALAWTAAIPAALAVGYLLLLLYFRAIGGYKAEVLVGHSAEDERFTGGTEGPGEG
ncbi:MAG TPA: hypothetical protein VKE94_08155, partial [Gemmataceae bacterium]|nr:hypothetical protein [Gemmataceae bacterium]